MKKRYAVFMGFLLFILIGFASCKNQANKSNETTTAENIQQEDSVTAAKLKAEIIDMIQNSPKGADLVDLINQAGAAYILNLTVPFEASEKMLTTVQRSLGQGLYGFDLKYASVYNRTDVTIGLRKILQQLFAANGLPLDLQLMESFSQRIQANQSDKDSLNKIIEEVTTVFHAHLAESDHPEIYALTVVGANVEALFILSQVALLARDNAPFLDLFSAQHERVKSMHQLFGKIQIDETVKPYTDKLEPIVAFFENHPTIGESELKEISPAIEDLRNFMLQ